MQLGIFIGLVFILVVMVTAYERMTAGKDVSKHERKVNWTVWIVIGAIVIGLIGWYLLGWRF
jgi:multisubunit Na+/H+ antiporter MnhB subunit